MTRFPAWVYREGTEPDPRFSLANERTFLAWLRTALALLAGGVGLEALRIPQVAGLRLAAAGLLLLLGLLAVAQGWIGWARSERSLRLSRALPGPTVGAVVAIGVLVVAVTVVVGSFL
ncbi:YidH family protein [Lysinimonas soli]|uniref:YidH family protein n=1 Tax=Lysinimonas soli TaxID=1074233 RepID=A0ABW0NVV5_9MICO